MDLAFNQQSQLEPLAIFAKHKIKRVIVTDFEKWFCQLKRRHSEIPSNCFWFDGECHWFSVYLFGEKAIPKLAHEYGELIQAILLAELNKRSKGTWYTQRRTDDQLYIPTDDADISTGMLVINSVCKRAGAWLQDEKSLVGVSSFLFDGRLWDLTEGPHGSVALPPDKAEHLVRELQTMRGGGCTRKQWERATGLLVWTVKIYPTTEPYLHAIRKCWRAAKHDNATVHASTEAKRNMRRFETLLEGDLIWTDIRTFFELEATVSWYTDGSGTGGVGGFDNNNHFSYELPREFDQHTAEMATKNLELSSAWIELVALLVGLYTLDTQRGTIIEWTTDSNAGHLIWRNHRSTAGSINKLLASIDFACARKGVRVQARWHRRSEPTAQLADDLSKFDLDRFRLQTGQRTTARRWVPNAVLRIITRSISAG